MKYYYYCSLLHSKSVLWLFSLIFLIFPLWSILEHKQQLLQLLLLVFLRSWNTSIFLTLRAFSLSISFSSESFHCTLWSFLLWSLFGTFQKSNQVNWWPSRRQQFFNFSLLYMEIIKYQSYMICSARLILRKDVNVGKNEGWILKKRQLRRNEIFSRKKDRKTMRHKKPHGTYLPEVWLCTAINMVRHKSAHIIHEV